MWGCNKYVKYAWIVFIMHKRSGSNMCKWCSIYIDGMGYILHLWIVVRKCMYGYDLNLCLVLPFAYLWMFVRKYAGVSKLKLSVHSYMCRYIYTYIHTYSTVPVSIATILCNVEMLSFLYKLLYCIIEIERKMVVGVNCKENL